MEIVDKSNKGGMSAGLAMLGNLPMGLGSAIGGSLGGSLGIDGEKEILMSNTLVRDVIKDLGLYTEYKLSRWGNNTMLYQDQPINVSLDAAHVEWLDSELPLYFHQILLEITKTDTGYEVETIIKENKNETELPTQAFASLPATIKTEAGLLTITENKLTERQAKPYLKGYTLKVTITPPTIAANDFIGRTTIEPPSKKVANILKISLKDQNLIRGIDYVNHLVDSYNKRANDEKNEEALKTDEFVNARLAKIDTELGSSDAAWENSKKSFQITEPEIDAQEALTKKSEYEAKLVAIGTELQLHDYLSEYINDPANLYEIIPSGLAGTSAPSSKVVTGGSSASSSASGNTSLIAQHNALVNERKDLLKSVSEMSPQVQRLNESIKELHPTLKLAMKRDRQQLVMQKNVVEREYAHYSGRIGSAPQMERVLTEIGRQREIKQGVYLLMLQKREETAMELANTTDKGKLIDEVQVDPSSSTPKKKVVFAAAVLIGLILPIVLIYLLLITKTKIDTLDDLKAVSKKKIIGEIPFEDVDEAVRTLRSNLLLSINSEQNVIMFASDADGDGKTYLAKSLTDSLNKIGKKALFMDLDLRSKTSAIHPADYLASDDFAKQMDSSKSNYDYVIVDTPAMGKFSDAYQIAQFVGTTLFVVKTGSTDKSVINNLNDKPLPNMLFVLNCINNSKKR